MQRQRPRLKNGVDLQLQSAFSDGNWTSVARLAEKRARSLNDQYYEIVKLCAESQLDDPTAKFAALAFVETQLKDGSTIKDVDALDLLEWAAMGLIGEDNFAQTMGPLRVRCVKAVAKDKIAATRCLETCLLHWDLVSAQQIAAVIDRSFPRERSFMFWNIVITHLLSQSPQTPTEKKKLYGTLAQRQIQRAAQSSEAGAVPPPRTVQTEEEILLLYDIVETHGTTEDFDALLTSTAFSPVTHFQQGRKALLERVISKHRRDRNWGAVYKLCADCLSKTDDSGLPIMLALDGAIWQHFIEAAGQIRAEEPDAPEIVQKFLLTLKSTANSRVIYRRNILLARLAAIFTLTNVDEDDSSGGDPSSLRVRELTHYIDDQASSPSCFDDIKGYVEQLDAPGMEFIAYHYVSALCKDVQDSVKSSRMRLLSWKLQYFVLSCPLMYEAVAGEQPMLRCTLCKKEMLSSPCMACSSAVSQAALAFYSSMSSDDGSTVESPLKTEILPEVALLVAFCSIRLASRHPSTNNGISSPANARHLLRALLILEHQLFPTPTHSVMSLVLVQLNLLLGSAPRAREVWEPLSVKRTVMDSLAPLFYDRLSTVSPSMLSQLDTWGFQLTDLLQSHYRSALRLQMPRQLIEAFEAGSYTSITQIPRYIQSLRTSTTRAMSLVEEARTERLLGQSFGAILEDARFTDVVDDIHLTGSIDYGSFPSWDCSTRAPIHAHLRLGPPPSNRRSHLSLLSEAFHSLLTYKAPIQYKPSQSATVTDRTYLVETIGQLSNSMAKHLSEPAKLAAELTAAELMYFETVGLLTSYIILCINVERTATFSETLLQVAEAVKAALDSLQARIEAPQGEFIEQLVFRLSSLHDLTMFHDTATATRLAAQWLLAHNERERERDRSGSSNLPKETVSQAKSLLSAADEALKHGKSLVVKMREDVSRGDVEAKLREWVFHGEGESLGHIVQDGTIAELVGSWRLNVTGWQQVKWE